MHTADERQTGEFLRDVFDRIPTGIAAFDRDFRLLEANATWVGFIERYTPSSAGDVVPGVTMMDLAPETNATLEPLFRRAVAGETVKLDGVRLESHGTVSYWDIILSPLTHDGEIVGLVEAANDATERVLANQTAREHADQFQRIFESTSDAVIITDLESGRVVEANPACCAIHGYTHEEFVGLEPARFIHPDSFHLFGEFVELISAGGTYRTRAWDVRKDGTAFPVEVFGAAVDYFGKRHAVAVLRDITEQLASEEVTARRQAELQEMVEDRTRELSALLEMAHAAASTLDVQSLLGLILDQLRDIADYSGASVSLLDGTKLVQFVTRRIGEAAQQTPTVTVDLVEESPFWQLIQAGAPAIIQDVLAAEPLATDFRSSVGGDVATLLPHVRGILAVPLRLEGKTVGILNISRDTPNAFEPRDVQVLEAVAGQAAIAIENARLFAAAEERSRELAALLSASQSVLASLDSSRALEELLDQLHKVIDYDGCSILTAPDDKNLVIVASRAAPHKAQHDATGQVFGQHESGAIWEAVCRRENVIIEDVRGPGAHAEAYRTGAGEHLNTTFAEVTSFLAVPLANKDGVFGMMTLSRGEAGYFTEHHGDLAAALANQASIALSNAGLFEEAERRAKEMEALSRVAASLTFDQPRSETLNILAQRVIDATRAVACSITLLGQEFQYRMSGSAGLPLDFTERIAEAVRNGAPSMTHLVVERGKRTVLRNARAVGVNDERFGRAREYFAAAEWDTVVLTPLIYGGRALGTLDVYYKPEDEPDERQLLFLGAIADQAAVAVENARLFAETRQRLRAAEALSRVASSLTFDRSIEDTLDILAENVVSATRALACTVVLVEEQDESVRSIGTYGLPQGYRESMRSAWTAGARAETMFVYHEQQPHLFEQARLRYLSYGDASPLTPFIRSAEWESIAALPIIFRGKSRGALNAYYLPGEEPDESELALLKSMADQTAVGVENARLFAETERRVREMEALYRADEQLHSSLRVEVVLQSLVDVAVDIIGADKSLLVVLDERTNRLRVEAARGFDENALDIAHHELQRLEPEALQRRHQPIIVPDARNDTRALRAVNDAAGIAAFVDVPIEVNGKVFGVFNVSYNSTRNFSSADTRLFMALSKRAGLAIENARLYERSQQAASLEERQRLARELHDSVSQALYGIALGAKTARTLLDRDASLVADPLDYVLSLAEAGLAELRSLIFELRPESLEQEGIVAAFEKQFAALRARHNIEVEADLGLEPQVSLEVKEVVYRIGQEAMHNTAKHARATRLDVELKRGDEEIALTIRDNGMGFNPDGEFPGHLGLKSMSERARNIGGRFVIESAEGAGTTVRLTVPLARLQ